jgi:hypothetical protein
MPGPVGYGRDSFGCLFVDNNQAIVIKGQAKSIWLSLSLSLSLTHTPSLSRRLMVGFNFSNYYEAKVTGDGNTIAHAREVVAHNARAEFLHDLGVCSWHPGLTCMESGKHVMALELRS